MIAPRILSYEDLLKRLEPYGCRRIARLQANLELWETGWQRSFTMSVEPGGGYDEWQYRQVLIDTIARTMPSDWNK